MLLSATTPLDAVGGELYYFMVTGHNGHTTKFQVEDELGWHDIPDDNDVIEHTDTHMGAFRMPRQNARYQLVITGGTGDIALSWTGINSFQVN